MEGVLPEERGRGEEVAVGGLLQEQGAPQVLALVRHSDVRDGGILKTGDRTFYTLERLLQSCGFKRRKTNVCLCPKMPLRSVMHMYERAALRKLQILILPNQISALNSVGKIVLVKVETLTVPGI